MPIAKLGVLFSPCVLLSRDSSPWKALILQQAAVNKTVSQCNKLRRCPGTIDGNNLADALTAKRFTTPSASGLERKMCFAVRVIPEKK
jgi:hypothetical protein